MQKFGIKPDRVFGFWDWVGGRYSIWSSIGLALTIAIGPKLFEEFLRGGYEIDTHFREAPLERNIPVLMGLIGIWYRNVWGFATQAVIPYDQRLGRFAAYLQQLDMESNGKSVHLDGTPVQESTGPVVWGEPGTNGQHAFFQLLHQGTEVVPIDFLVAAEPTKADETHHELLVSNCLAQSQALMRGRDLAEVKAQLAKSGMAPDAAAGARASQGVFRQSPLVHLHVQGARSENAGPADRALRAPRVHHGGDLGHQSIRPMGGRTRQGTRLQACAHRGRRFGIDGRARRFDGGPSGAPPRLAA